MKTQLTAMLNSAADAWAAWMWPMTWHVTLLVLVVAALTWLLRGRSARLRYALWLLVSIRLLLPPTLALATGWGWWLLPTSDASAVGLIATEPLATHHSPEVETGPMNSIQPERFDRSERLAALNANSRSNNTLVIKPPQPLAAVAISLRGWLFWGWLFGVAILAIRLLYGCIYAARMVRRAQDIAIARGDGQEETTGANGSGIAELLESCLHRSGIRQTMRLCHLPDAGVPMLIGFVRPTIILPTGLDKQLTSQELEAVIIHELQHVTRHDAVVHLVQSLLGVVYFFHPLVWLTNRVLNGLREDACDEATVAVLEGQRRNYGAGIVKVAKLMSGPIPSMSLGIVESGGQVKRRLRRILDPRLPVGRRLSWSAFALLLLLSAVMLPVAARPGRSAAQEPSKPTATAPAAEPSAIERAGVRTLRTPKAERPKNASTTGTMRILAIDSADQPLPGANIVVNAMTDTNVWNTHPTYLCDDHGEVDVALPSTLSLLRIYANRDGYAALIAQWRPEEQDDGRLIPKAFTFRMQKGTVIGGVVKDDSGLPIAGVRVEVMYNNDGEKTQLAQRPIFDPWLAQGNDAKVTDSQGRWMLDNVPPGDDPNLRVKLTSSDYVSDMTWGDMQRKQHVTTKALRAQTATIVMQRGTEITGILTDPDKKPVARAVVVWGDRPYFEHRPQQEVRSDENGRYRFPPLPAGPMAVTVMAQGWMPVRRVVDIASEMPPVDFQLKPGKTLRVRFVDTSGKPLPDVEARIQGWQGKESLYNDKHPNVVESGIPRQAKDGVYEWTWAPDDAVTYRFTPWNVDRRFAKNEVTLTADDQEHVQILQPLLHITGRVTDAKTGKPIERFTIIPVIEFSANLLHAGRDKAKDYSDGQYAFDLERTDVSHRLRIEAKGYRTSMSDSYHVGHADPICDFRLVPAPSASGRIVGIDGKPVVGAKVFLATKTQGLRIYDHKDETPDNEVVESDSLGAFAFPPQFERYTVIAIHDDGYAEVTLEPNQLPGELKLAQWARVEGRVLQAGAPVAGADIRFDPLRPPLGKQPYIDDAFAKTTDEAGRFVFERVPPLKIALRPALGPWQEYPITSAEWMPLDLKPGQHVTLDLGGDGAQIRGRVALKGDAAHDIDLNYSLNWLIRIAPGIEPPAGIASQEFDWRKGWNDSWSDSTEGGIYRQTLHHYFVKLARDGTLLVSGVPAGDYDLAFKIYERPEGCLVDPVGTRVVRFHVAESDVAKGTLDLGSIEIDAALGPKPGELVPDFSFELLNGGPKKLSELRGRYVLIDFWATWCSPCVASLPEVRTLHDGYHAGGRLVVVGLSLDADKSTVLKFVQQHGLPWMQGFLGDSTEAKIPIRFGVSSVPAYVLIDPAGKLVAKYRSADEAKEKIAAILDSPPIAP